MNESGLLRAHRLVYGMGLAICFGTPCLIAVLVLSGVVPPGEARPEGIYQQWGYLFTGLVFLSAAGVWGRNRRMLREFEATNEARSPALIFREGLFQAAALESSALCGLVYWLLVGHHAARHVWSFILLTPVLFLALVPRPSRWSKGSVR